jgi:hypothetical protein
VLTTPMTLKSFKIRFSPVILLVLAVSLWCTGVNVTQINAAVQDNDLAVYEYSIMRPDAEQLREWKAAVEAAPKAYIDPWIAQDLLYGGSLDLLPNLQYTPSERNQGYCGNCWVWAGTGVLEVALNVQGGTKDRLSIQYFNSCDDSNYWGHACCGGNLDEFAQGYIILGQAIPWSNTNAGYDDYFGVSSCYADSDVSCASISTSPNYPINFMQAETIVTHGVAAQTAIANIKNVLNQGKAIWFAFYLANDSDWNNFFSFWLNQPETAVWDPDFSCGHTWIDGEAGGHAVVCVGYNDNDPDNSYWIMLNSWGTAGGRRPNGLFRLNMDMNYSCSVRMGATNYYSFDWQTLNVDFGAGGEPEIPTVTSFSINNGATSTTVRKVTLNNSARGIPTHYMASESSTFVNAAWQSYSAAPSFLLRNQSGTRTVYFKVKNDLGESAIVSDTIQLNLRPRITSFAINNGAATTQNRTVTLNNTATENPTAYMASESSSFSGAVWKTYSTAPTFTLSPGNGTKTVYFKVKNSVGRSAISTDTIVKQ